MIILSITNTTILFALSIIHFNWAFGGSWGLNKALPTNEKGDRVLNPKKIDSAVVGLGLLGFATYFLIYGNLVGISLPDWLHTYGIWGISGIFFLRAFGDFKYVGFFKRIKTTEFARLDSKYYSPLCLLLSIIGIGLTFIK